MKRKFGCVLLAFVMMLATVPLLGLPAFAEESVNLLTNVEKQDGKIVVTVSSENEIAVDALSFKMAYDESCFSLVSASGVCADHKSTYSFGETKESPYYCAWVNMAKDSAGKVAAYKGDIFKLEFKVKSGSAEGEYAFSVSDTDCAVLEKIFDSDGNIESFKDTNADITVQTGTVNIVKDDIPSEININNRLVSRIDKTNGYVFLTVAAEAEQGTDALSFRLEFDENVFSLESVEELCEQKYNGQCSFGETMESPYYCSWVNMAKTTDESNRSIASEYNGDLFKFKFAIRNDAQIGEYAFTAENTEFSVFEWETNQDGSNSLVENIISGSDFEGTNTVKLEDADIPKGVTVSGKVQSYNPNNKTVLVLQQGGEDKFSTEISAEEGSGQKIQDFSFEAVPEGTYDLVVTKAGHLTYTIKDVIVRSEDIDLTEMTDKAYQTITLLAGDVNGDGSITEDDVFVIRYTSNINKETENASNKNADINGDGSVTEDDVFIVRYTTHINKSTANCTYNFKEE